MEFHCLWFNNCVGINNHKYYLNFIGWVCVMGWSSTLLALDAVQIFFFEKGMAKKIFKLDGFFIGLFAVLALMYLGGYFGYHMYLLLIEELECQLDN